jgi:hypothetical protein
MTDSFKNIAKIIAMAMLVVAMSSCLKDNRERIQCEDFSNQNDLVWLAGLVGDSLTFKNAEGSEISFVVDDKYILHTTSYLTNSGCNCHDIWGMLLTSSSDSISMHSHLVYTEYQEVEYDNLFMKIDDKLTRFFREDVTKLSTFEVDGVVLNDVKRYHFPQAEELQFRTIYLAKDLGIVQMERVGGEIWINTQLDRFLPVDFNSFRYSESDCQ